MKLDKRYKLKTHLPQDIYYIHKLDHRNGSPQKSQWAITEASERVCFKGIVDLVYVQKFDAWGLHFENGNVQYLGQAAARSADPFRNLFIAKFIDSNNNNKWHGYPANPADNPQDIPSPKVLELWLEQGHLKPAKIRKIAKGQRCKL